jgi:F0F1-type ATP synthase assembly protein I
MEQPQSTKSPKSPQNNRLNDYAKYSGLAFQMGAVIAIATWGGIKLDKLTGIDKPIFTIILSLLGVFTAIYVAIKDFIKK